MPFTIPGEAGLCDTTRTSRDDHPGIHPGAEREDLANPGTVAHLKLKLGGNREPPSRVTLGAWPDDNLQTLLPASRQGAGDAVGRAGAVDEDAVSLRLGGRDLLE